MQNIERDCSDVINKMFDKEYVEFLTINYNDAKTMLLQYENVFS